MIQPFMWRSKSPSVPCLAPAPCTSSPSKHEGQREQESATPARDSACLGRSGEGGVGWGGSFAVLVHGGGGGGGELTWSECLETWEVLHDQT